MEQKRFDKALQFLDDAVKKYEVTFNCGTGYQRQQDEYDFLYASCYQGLGRNKEIIDLLLPSCLVRDDEILVDAIRKTFLLREIKDSLLKAENSIECYLDTFPSYAYQTIYHDTGNEKSDTIHYFQAEQQSRFLED